MNGTRKQFPPGLRHGPPPDASRSHGLRQSLLTLLLVLTLAAGSLPVAPVAALSLPWRQHALDEEPAATGSRMDPLQEVSPPAAVQQLQSALVGRQPVVEILSPQDDTVLPAGPWSLKLRVHDWPLVDGGPLGVGPHLAVQLDQEPPRIWTGSEGVMPELSPGSHRLTIYAALPWGEARKTPGAVQQIRLHRTAPNPLSLPSAGSPQLLAVSPSGPSAAEPLLLDWLLLDAPLQDVGGRGTQWRLRVTINGEDVLLDQQSPLWLRGWKSGLNALRLELLDARGEPLNPPFNSLVQEVDLSPRAGAPRWRGEKLSAAELAMLLGEAPPVSPSGRPSPVAPSSPEGTLSAPAVHSAGAETSRARTDVQAPLPPASPDTGSTEARPSGGNLAEQAQAPEPEERQPSSAVPMPESGSTTPTGAPSPEIPRILGPAAMGDSMLDAAARPAPGEASPPVQTGSKSGITPGEGRLDTDRGEDLRNDEPASPAPLTGEQAGAAGPAADVPQTRANDFTVLAQPAPAAETRATEVGLPAPDIRDGTSAPSPDRPQPAMTPTTATAPQLPSPSAGTPQLADDGERIHPTSALSGRARDLVNDDGTLRRPERTGPLAGLRERLQR